VDDIASAEVRKTFEHHHEWDGGASVAAPTDSETPAQSEGAWKKKSEKGGRDAGLLGQGKSEAALRSCPSTGWPRLQTEHKA